MSNSTSQTGDWVILARLKRPQGRNGEVSAEVLTDFPERFQERRQLVLLAANGQARPVELESHWLHKGGIVLKFAGVDSINQAEELRGFAVAISSEERAELDADSAYISDLIGCTVYNLVEGESHPIGKITDVDRKSTEVPLLIIRRKGEEEFLIPFAKAYLRKLETAAQRIEMELPEGLLEINNPMKEDERNESNRKDGRSDAV
jgi:16S rRNA processing protein RimM